MSAKLSTKLTVKLSDKQAEKEIKRLQKLLADVSVSRTAHEWAVLRGKLGGLIGRNHPGRVAGGKKGAAIRWAKTTARNKSIAARKAKPKKDRRILCVNINDKLQ